MFIRYYLSRPDNPCVVCIGFTKEGTLKKVLFYLFFFLKCSLSLYCYVKMNKLRENFPKNVIEVKKKLEKNLKKVAKEKIDKTY